MKKKVLIAVFICVIFGITITGYADEGESPIKLNVTPHPATGGVPLTVEATIPIGGASAQINVHTYTPVHPPGSPMINGISGSASIPVGKNGSTLQPYIGIGINRSSGGTNITSGGANINIPLE